MKVVWSLNLLVGSVCAEVLKKIFNCEFRIDHSLSNIILFPNEFDWVIFIENEVFVLNQHNGYDCLE